MKKIYYVVKINKQNNPSYRTIVQVAKSKGGKAEYVDLRDLTLISNLAIGSKPIIINRGLGTNPIDRIVSCDSTYVNLVDDETSKPLDMKTLDDDQRNETIDMLIAEFDAKRKTKHLPKN